MKQKVLVSIDTEAPVGDEPVTKMIIGKIENKEYGINFIMDFLDANGIKGLFFVDFAEAWDYGESKIAEVVQQIYFRGHDVGVHIHPDHMKDKNRRFLWEYTYDEQYEMISSCTSLYEKILCKRPLSFRAGRYSADKNTLQVLDELGYRYDMSEFFGSRYCKIRPEVTWNQVVKIPGLNLVEVPVTTFRSFKTPIYERYDQIDSGMIPSEFRRVISEINKRKTVDVISMFVHSFQFIDWRMNPNSPKFNRKKNRYFKKNFCTLMENDVVFISEADLMNITMKEFDLEFELDLSGGIKSYIYFIIRALKVIKDRLENNI